MQMALKLYQLAAKLGHKEALYNLGVFYAQGKGVRKNFQQAKICFEKAAKLGDSSSMLALKMLHPSNHRKFSSEPEDFIDQDPDSSSELPRKEEKRLISAFG
jgi:TPR repeat protein